MVSKERVFVDVEKTVGRKEFGLLFSEMNEIRARRYM